MITATLIVLFFLLIAIGAPIAVALGGSVIVTSLLMSPIPIAVIGQKVLANLDHFTLMAVPFFFFAAALMENGGLVRRLIDFANSIVGHWRGGLGVTSVLSCIFFAAISGSSPATVAAVGRVMYPALLREGYTARYSIGALATAGSIGILIPPSIPMILYGFITETSITRLFIAGIVPGLIYGGGMMLMASYLARREDIPPRPKASWGERWRAFKRAGPALSLPLIIIIGIYGLPRFDFAGLSHSGGAIFTPTEASVVAASLALLIGMFVYRELSVRGAVRTIVATAPAVGMIFFIATNALLFAFFLTKLGVPQAISNALIAMDMPPWAFLLLVNVVLMIIGFFLEGVPVILMFVPVLFPAATAMGIDPVHFGVIVIVNIELALVTPPVGLNLFVGSSVSGLPVFDVFKAALPWMIVTGSVLILVTYVPWISLFLPGLMFG
ncbi:TRAP transporter large permease [Lutibaculum baratangense]|uniref:TRAP transporter large permease protein n=1 Tax=Lutibaculum baratangense AMV1 TaxID=631454 RepID=V4RKF4_9HYPH|nr:TRAP transporter large permease [Lutibaculum baratangense]ESR23735.1 TRAP-type C4-dicarboxylate transport system, large permease component [Lutibaculum baratangense AMV1]